MAKIDRGLLTLLSIFSLTIACSESETNQADAERQPTPTDVATSITEEKVAEFEDAAPADRNSALLDGIHIQRLLPVDQTLITTAPQKAAERNAFFGDLHVHTTYSFDAFVFGTLATPYDAYRYARGEAIKHPGGFDVQLRKPLDFYAVTDHAIFLGTMPEGAKKDGLLSDMDISKTLRTLNAPDNMGTESIIERIQAFASFAPAIITGLVNKTLSPDTIQEIARTAWLDTIQAADEFNEPGEFTTFVAYEYTSSTEDSGNLHRNVIFKNSDKVPAVPFSRLHSLDPEDLWDWMDGLREQGIESLAIPHNSNGSNGHMFALTDLAGEPFDKSYIDRRLRNEPLVEITQVKGTSDTHPALSMNDEWADFEIAPYRVATLLESEPKGSYVRDAYLNGLSINKKLQANPYKFGLIGSSDTHTGAIADDESNYFAKVGMVDAHSYLRGSTPLPENELEILGSPETEAFIGQIIDIDGRKYVKGAFETFGASGLAAVWADENTREAIYDAFRRKETFATTGPRLRVRFFAGYGFGADPINAPDAVATAYDKGVPMGADLLAQGDASPEFLVWAQRDLDGAPLQRIQIIKGVMAEAGPTEKVYDVACSEGMTPDPTTHRCPDNGAKVNITDCSISADVGAAELKTVWKDPDYNASQEAFYYVRVLENPTCRWSTWDAVKANVPPRPDLKKTIQERAWSSPIWVRPSEEG